MAPEMLGALPERLGVRTDVYLLGSVLFEIVDGHPPHDGANLAAILRQVLESPRELPESTPEELDRIVHKAMAFEPSERFEDAQGFRSALTHFLEHRGSLALTRDADERCIAGSGSPSRVTSRRLRVRVLGPGTDFCSRGSPICCSRSPSWRWGRRRVSDERRAVTAWNALE